MLRLVAEVLLASLLGLAVWKNTKLNVETRTDHLTGLPNRRVFDEKLGELTDRSKRYKIDFSLVAIDLDGFSMVNNTFGHDAGDRCLVTVSAVLKAQARTVDIVCRMSGAADEFFVLLPETGSADAGVYARRVSEAIRKEQCLPGVPVTASIGVASYLENCPSGSPGDIVTLADAALYAAKGNGKNQVVFAKSTDG